MKEYFPNMKRASKEEKRRLIKELIIDKDNDEILLSNDEFFNKYGYYPDEDCDWQTPLEFGDN